MTDTVLDLKKKIETIEGLDPRDQNLYLKGYLLNEDNLVLSEFLHDEAELVLVLPQARDEDQVNHQDVWVASGEKHDCKLKLVQRENSLNKPDSEVFGLVRMISGHNPGSRKYKLEKFSVRNKHDVLIRVTDDLVEVYLEGEKIEANTVEYYQEKKSPLSTDPIKDRQFSEFVDKFIREIGSLLYPGNF